MPGHGRNGNTTGSLMTVTKMPSSTSISVVTNACSLDAPRLRMVLPHWLRVFDSILAELIVVIDPTKPEGRISQLHRSVGSIQEVRDTLKDLEQTDSRIQVRDMPVGTELETVLEKWFCGALPIRCRAGTPIAAFVAAIEMASKPIVLRADCDMLFFEAGWLCEGIRNLTTGEIDLLEPCNLSRIDAVSTRAMMVNHKRIEERLLPIVPLRVDVLRRFKAYWERRSPWLSLEQMLEKERHVGRLRFKRLSQKYGHSMHVRTRSEAELAIIPSVVTAMETGLVPASQLASGENFDLGSWRDFIGVDV